MKLRYKSEAKINKNEFMEKVHSLADKLDLDYIGTRNDGRDYLDNPTGCFIQVYAEHVEVSGAIIEDITEIISNLENFGIKLKEVIAI